MRLVLALGLLASSAVLAQDPKAPAGPEEVKPRFGVAPKLKTYPQNTAKKALASAIEAIEKPELPYLLAHLIDEGFVELRLTERAKQHEATTEVELSRLRDFQL